MMSQLGNLAFLNPMILWALGVLPILWLLLRITPPGPRLVALPTTRFLTGLIPEKQTSSHTPWWLLLLRMMIAALVIFALARPVLNPSENIAGNGPLRIVLDNGWPAAANWDTETRAALDAVARAGRDGREIYILTTAPLPDVKKPAMFGPLAAGQAEAIIKGLKPQPWPADYKQAAQLVDDKADETMWFGHGLDEGGIDEVVSALKKYGNILYTSPAPENLPLMLAKDEEAESDFQILVVAPKDVPAGRPVTVQARGADGSILDQQSFSLEPDKLPARVKFEIPDSMRGDISSFRLSGALSAGGVLLLNESTREKLVGLVGPADDEDTKPFIEDRYYLKRAIEPFAELFQGDVQEILKKSPAVIILPDIATIRPEDLTTLEKWVKKGGLLLRFAGPKMAKSQGDSFLTPVPLRLGGRSMDGSLTWEAPAKLKSFSETSPFYGIQIHEDIPVRQQILAEPTEDIEERTWAKLEDGTPLITAAPLEKGLLVMIHTTATPDWSDLPLSGVFVEILQRIINISGNPQAAFEKVDGLLQPVWMLDGFGALKKPSSTIGPVASGDFLKTIPSADHPPGIYGREGFQQALNIGNHVKNLNVAKIDAIQRIYGSDYERDLMPYLLYAALMLLLLDWIIMTVLMSGFRTAAKIVSVFLVLSFSYSAQAQDMADKRDVEYADGFFLAFIKSGDIALDGASQSGLENLGEILRSRTAVEPAGVAALDPDHDDLVFFPIIYWPISATQKPLSEVGIKNIQNYLDHGGTILFDTRDSSYSAGTLTGTANANILRSVTASLNIRPLEPLPKDHVLNRSFYLFHPGRDYDPGTIWAETAVSGRDGVSSVLIGSHDWASHWAQGDNSREQELEYRFGVNVVMYALTGNYKADQVHIPFILERLGE